MSEESGSEVPALRPALVGRDDEVVQLRRRLSEAAQGSGSVVLLTAGTGIGKTRMVEEAAAIAATRSMDVLTSAAPKAGPKRPHQLFAGVLTSLLRQATGDERETVTELAGSLLPHLWYQVFPGRPAPAHPVASGMDPAVPQTLFLTRLLELLQRRATRAPVLLCLEDVHRADSASLSALNLLARRAAAARMLVILSVCPEEAVPDADGELSRTLRSMTRHPHVHEMNLGPLDTAAVRALVSSCFPRQDFSSEFLALLSRRSGGVPMRVLEHVNLLLQRGVIYAVQDLWLNRPLLEQELPATGDTAIQQRLACLHGHERLLLGLGAAQGHSFRGEIVARTLARPLADTLKELDAIGRRTGLLEPTEGGFRFTHPDLAETLLASLPEPRRRHAHRCIAHILERDETHPVEAIAHHLFEAGHTDRALPVLVATARRSLAAGACREARDHLARSAQICDALGPGAPRTLRLEVLILQAQVEGRLNAWQRALELCRQALDAAAGQDEDCGRALLQMARVHHRLGSWNPGVQAYEEAIEHFTRCGLADQTARCRVGLGHLCFERADFDAAEIHFDAARTTALRRNDQGLLGSILGDLGRLATVRGECRQAVLYYTEAIISYTRSRHAYGICQIHHHLGMSYAAQEAWEDALAAYGRGEKLAAGLGALDVLARIKVHAAAAYLGQGDIDAADSACQQATYLVDQLSDPLGSAECRKVEGMILRARARYDEGRKHLEQGLHAFRHLENDLGVAACEQELGLLEQARGDLPAARMSLRRSVRIFAGIGAVGNLRRSQRLLDEIAP